MKRIVRLVLMMLIGGYGAAQAQSQTDEGMDAAARRAVELESVTEIDEAIKVQEATKDFLGLEWGAGIGVMGSFGGDDAVEKASIVNNTVQVEEEDDMRPRLFLEMHVLLGGGGSKVGSWRNYQEKKAAYQMKQMKRADQSTASSNSATTPLSFWPEPPLWGFGPFIALQGSDNRVIDAVALGVLWGFRKSPDATTSLNIGLGASFDSNVQVLAKGFNEGGSPPVGETEVRFKKEGRFGWIVMTSFTF